MPSNDDTPPPVQCELTRLGVREIRRQLLEAFPEATPAHEVIRRRTEHE